MQVGVAILLFAGVAAAAGLAPALGPGYRPSWPRRLCTIAGRAETLPRRILGAEAYRRLARRGYLDVPSPAITGRTCRIPRPPGGIEVIEDGVVITRLCVAPACRLPAADVLLTHELLIAGGESRYLRVANHSPAGAARRIAPGELRR